MIAERNAAALAHKRARRQAYSTVTLGFRCVGRRLIEVPEDLALMSQIEAWRARGWSLHRIAPHPNAAGVGGKERGHWYTSSIRRILRNPIYGDVASAFGSAKISS